MLRGLVVTIAAVFAAGTLSAQSHEQMVISSDTVAYTYTPIDQTSRAQTGIEGFGLRLNDYLTFAEDDPRRVKFSVVGAPAYSESTGWRLVAEATLRYRTVQQGVPHRLSLRGSASLRGCYALSLDGVNNFVGGHTLSYGGSFALDKYRLYGLDYAASIVGNYGEYRSRNYGSYLHYDYDIFKNVTIGIRANYVNKSVVETDAYSEAIIGESIRRVSILDFGFGVRYSNYRVEDINLARGVTVAVEYSVSPTALNSVGATMHEGSAVVDWYQPLWSGGLLALDIYGEYHSANTPWMCRSMLGGDSRMRGYYYGCFSGNTLATAQLELRQRVWEGLVVAGWGGCGEVFSEGDPASWGKLLPSYGVGVRWYFNPTSLVRIDCGFGRDTYAFVVGYTEAF